MTTIKSTASDFRRSCEKFMRISGDKSYSQESIKGAHKALTLKYLGLEDVTDDELSDCAVIFEVVTNGAIARGWEL